MSIRCPNFIEEQKIVEKKLWIERGGKSHHESSWTLEWGLHMPRRSSSSHLLQMLATATNAFYFRRILGRRMGNPQRMEVLMLRKCGRGRRIGAARRGRFQIEGNGTRVAPLR
jgi:hypothetical protein